MNRIFALIALSASLVGSNALAVTNGTVGKYSRAAVTVKQNGGFPTQCRDAIARAVTTWNAQAS